MPADEYTDLAALKRSLGIDAANTDENEDLLAAIRAASRHIDQMTGTTFYPVTETRRFAAEGYGNAVWVDRFTDTTGLVVKTGSGGNYATTLNASAYLVAPYSAPARGGAYDRIEFPAGAPYARDGWPAVEITAAWGYATVPAPVEVACRLIAAQLYHRKDSPHGVLSYGDDPAAQYSSSADSDVRRLLAPYMDLSIA